MRKANRKHRFGGTYLDRAAGFGWLNWYYTRKRVSLSGSHREYKKFLRRISYRRVF